MLNLKKLVCILAICVVAEFAHPHIESERNDSYDIELLPITLSQGILVGRRSTLPNGSTFRSFEGIPYAVPPIGENRFKDPIPAPAWEGERSASEPSAICSQFNESLQRLEGEEDCLYLNVYAPDDIPGILLPVMVYLHGGALKRGSSQEAVPDLIVPEGIVLVSVNYRLGVMGFLNLEIAEVPGNAGHKDQVTALRWVRDNIESFGGDPNDVTLAGQSAGSRSTMTISFSEMSRGLFHKIIGLSTSPSRDIYVFQGEPLETVHALADILNLDSTDRRHLLVELQGLPHDDIMMASRDGIFSEDVDFFPSPELEYEGVERLISKAPYLYLEAGEFPDIPTWISYTSVEYAYLGTADHLAERMSDPLAFTRKSWNLLLNQDLLEETAATVKEFYFGDQNLTFSPEDVDQAVTAIELLGDIRYLLSIYEGAGFISSFSTQPTYLLRFSYRGDLNNDVLEKYGIQGATHADDLKYLFPKEYPRVDDYSRDGWVRRRFAKLVSNFVKTGNPTPGPANQLLPSIWLPLSGDEVHYLDLNSEMTPSVNPDAYKISFWNTLEETVTRRKEEYNIMNK